MRVMSLRTVLQKVIPKDRNENQYKRTVFLTAVRYVYIK